MGPFLSRVAGEGDLSHRIPCPFPLAVPAHEAFADEVVDAFADRAGAHGRAADDGTHHEPRLGDREQAEDVAGERGQCGVVPGNLPQLFFGENMVEIVFSHGRICSVVRWVVCGICTGNALNVRRMCNELAA